MIRGKKPRYTNADKARWVTLYKQGLSLQDIADEYGCTREYIRQVTSKIIGYPVGLTKRRVQDLVGRDTKIQIVINEMNKIIDGLNRELRKEKMKYCTIRRWYSQRTNTPIEVIEKQVEDMSNGKEETIG